MEYTTLTQENAQAVFDTLRGFWKRPWDARFTEDFLNWRYLQRPNGEPIVAISDGRCVGIIDLFLRRYHMNGEVRVTREPCDWYCVPEQRGIGLRLMKAAMNKGDPMLGIGLPFGALAIAPRLKFVHVATGEDYVLPVSLRAITAGLLRRLHLGNGEIAHRLPSKLNLAALLTRRVAPPPGAAVFEIDAENYPEMTPSREHGVTPILDGPYYRWLLRAPSELGKVFGLLFNVGGIAHAMTISRLERTQGGTRAKIIHWQFADLSQQTVDWALSETISLLVANGAETIHCRSSCPQIGAALRRLRFFSTDAQKVLMWLPDDKRPVGSINLTLLRADDAMIPSLIHAT
jgi:hypothetical protein